MRRKKSPTAAEAKAEKPRKKGAALSPASEDKTFSDEYIFFLNRGPRYEEGASWDQCAEIMSITEKAHISGAEIKAACERYIQENHIQIEYEYNKSILARLKNMHTDKQDALLECLKDSNFWRFLEREDRAEVLKQLAASGRKKSA